MIRHATLQLLVLSVISTLPVLAQTIEVRTLALRSGEMPEVHLKGEKDYQALRFSSVQPAEAVRALAANPLPLFVRGMDEKGKPSFVISGQVKLPADAKGILLLGWIEGKEPRYIAIKDDFAAARFNDWLLINASSKPVALKVGDIAKPLLLKPGVAATHRIDAPAGQGAAVIAQAPVDGESKVFYSTYWPVQNGKRAVVLFVDDGRGIAVKRIMDRLAEQK